jgi:hypothetical protein
MRSLVIAVVHKQRTEATVGSGSFLEQLAVGAVYAVLFLCQRKCFLDLLVVPVNIG